MKIRKKAYGNANIVGKNIEKLRKEKNIKQRDFIAMIQTAGYDMNPTSYSKLEGQLKVATDKEIFTGDTLFRLSVGRTDLESGDWNSLVKSIGEKLYTLDEDLVVYPGHGAPSSIGFEKRANPFV